MGESTPSLGSRLRGAAVVLVLAIGLPILAMVPWGDGTLLTPAVLVAAFGLVCALNAGWRRTLALVPVLVVGTVLGSLTAGTPAWPWLAGALGAAVGLSTRAGLAAPAVIAGFITIGVPPAPDGVPWARLVVVAVVGLYTVVVARALGVPAVIPGRRLTWPQAVVTAVVCAAAVSVAARLAQASDSPFGAWVPAALLLLVLPSAELILPRRAAHRVVGTLLGAVAGVALGAWAPVPPPAVAALALYLCLVLTRPMWLSTTLSTTAVLLLLDPAAESGAAGTRLGAAVAAGVLGVAAAALLTVLGRLLPAEAREVAEEASHAQRVAPRA
ncbi:FUSC family protein [Georgenia phoenicis]|uniref:FUSC family protein n=1 Tax=unclassified Georgenia TaxID=2626815 RepID=UPI0039AF0FFC